MKQLLLDVFGKDLERYESISPSLPIYLINQRQLYNISIMGESFILVMLPATNRFNVSTLKKQILNYQRTLDNPVVYGFNSVTSFQRKSLIENRVPFVAENGQIFLPFLGTVFGQCSSTQLKADVDHFSPSAQLLLFLLMYKPDGYKINKGKVAGTLNISLMSITRAVRELVALNFISETQQGTEKVIQRVLPVEDAYELAKPYLINPVYKTIFVQGNEVNNNSYIRAGEYNLAERSMLGYPRYMEYSISKELYSSLDHTEIDPTLTESPLVKVQVWKYDPSILSDNNEVDPLSLICSFKEEGDERIQGCLEEVEKEIFNWRITI